MRSRWLRSHKGSSSLQNEPTRPTRTAGSPPTHSHDVQAASQTAKPLSIVRLSKVDQAFSLVLPSCFSFQTSTVAPLCLLFARCGMDVWSVPPRPLGPRPGPSTASFEPASLLPPPRPLPDGARAPTTPSPTSSPKAPISFPVQSPPPLSLDPPLPPPKQHFRPPAAGSTLLKARANSRAPTTTFPPPLATNVIADPERTLKGPGSSIFMHKGMWDLLGIIGGGRIARDDGAVTPPRPRNGPVRPLSPRVEHASRSIARQDTAMRTPPAEPGRPARPPLDRHGHNGQTPARASPLLSKPSQVQPAPALSANGWFPGFLPSSPVTTKPPIASAKGKENKRISIDMVGRPRELRCVSVLVVPERGPSGAHAQASGSCERSGPSRSDTAPVERGWRGQECRSVYVLQAQFAGLTPIDRSWLGGANQGGHQVEVGRSRSRRGESGPRPVRRGSQGRQRGPFERRLAPPDADARGLRRRNVSVARGRREQRGRGGRRCRARRRSAGHDVAFGDDRHQGRGTARQDADTVIRGRRRRKGGGRGGLRAEPHHARKDGRRQGLSREPLL